MQNNWNDESFFADFFATFLGGVAGAAAGVHLVRFFTPVLFFLMFFFGLGLLTKLAFIACLVALPFAVAFTWGRAYAFLPQLFDQFGIAPETLLIAAPMLLSLAALLIALVLTFARHRGYALKLLVCYLIVFIPYALLQCGWVQGLASGAATLDALIAADLNVALSCWAMPGLALFVFHRVDGKVQELRRVNDELARAGKPTLVDRAAANFRKR